LYEKIVLLVFSQGILLGVIGRLWDRRFFFCGNFVVLRSEIGILCSPVLDLVWVDQGQDESDLMKMIAAVW
jgi:hypothetical protein